MPSVTIPFATTSSGGVLAYASGGRVVNAMAQPLTGGVQGIVFCRAPGLRLAFTTDAFRFRGALEVDGGCYVVLSNACYYVTYSGTYAATLIGSVPGELPVTIAANNKKPDRDVLCVCEFGVYRLTPTSVAAFSDPDAPGIPTSIAFNGGYFILTYADGTARSSGVNDVTFDPLDFATSESAPDGLLRAIRRGRELILFGSQSVEFWVQNAEVVGFAFSFQTAVKGGIVGAHAITGWEGELPADVPLFFVSVDNTVKSGTGYTWQTVSSLDVQRDIAAEPSKGLIRMSSFVNTDGVPHVVLHLTNATWVYDTRHQLWHQRQSYGRDNWRIAAAFGAFGKWLGGDTQTGEIFEISADALDEAGQELVWELESAASKQFPSHYTVKAAHFDFATGVGYLPWASEPQRNPQVIVSWSDDGSRTWSNGLQRELGRSGRYNERISIYRAGRPRSQGRRWRLRVSDPVPIAFLGGVMEVG